MQQFADGGIVEPDARQAAEAVTSGIPGVESVGNFLAGIPNFLGSSIQAGAAAPYGMTAGVLAPEAAASLMQPVTVPVEPPQVVQPPKVQPAPALPSYLQSTQAMAQKPAAAPQMGVTAPMDPMANYIQAFDSMKAANMGVAKAQANAAEETLKAQNQFMADMRKLQSSYESNLKTLDDENAKLQQDVLNTKIDPNKIYSNASTGNRVLAGISILLGGLSQGLTGAKSNPAMDVINNAIDRDIDAQKADLGRKQNLLSFNMQKYGKLDAATAATRAQLLGITQAQISAAAAKSGSDVAISQARMANGQIDLQKSQILQGVASQQTLQNVLSAPNGIPPSLVTKLPMEMRKTLVKVPTGNFYQAKDEASAQRADKGLESVNTTQSLLDQAKAFMAAGRAAPGGERSGQADVINEALTLEIKKLGELGVLSGDDKKIIDAMKPKLNEYSFREREVAKANQMSNYVNMKIKGFLKQTVPDYTPSAIKIGRAHV